MLPYKPNLNLELVEPALSVRNYRERSAYEHPSIIYIHGWERRKRSIPQVPSLCGPDTDPLATLTNQKETEMAHNGVPLRWMTWPSPKTLLTRVWGLISEAIPGRKLERAQARKGGFTPSPRHQQWVNKQNKHGISRAKSDIVRYRFLASSWHLLHRELPTQVGYSLGHICPLEVGILGDSILPQSNS